MQKHSGLFVGKNMARQDYGSLSKIPKSPNKKHLPSHMDSITKKRLKYEIKAEALKTKLASKGILHARNAKLTKKGVIWWKTQLKNTIKLEEIIRWDSLKKSHRELLKTPVINKIPQPNDGWDTAAAIVLQHKHGIHNPKILVNLKKIPHPQALLEVLTHEITHLIQYKTRRLQDTFNQNTNLNKMRNRKLLLAMEKEAGDVSDTIPLIPWPKYLVGEIKDFPFIISHSLIPSI